MSQPDNAVILKGVAFDPLTSTQTDASLIAITSPLFTTVSCFETASWPGEAGGAQACRYLVTFAVDSELEFSPTALPCTKMTVALVVARRPSSTVSYYLAKAINGNTYLLKKVLTNPAYDTTVVFDMTGASGHPIIAAPKDPVIGSTCLYLMDGDGGSPDAITPGSGGECFVADTSAMSPQGVTGCTRLRRKVYETDLYVKPGVGIVHWQQRQFGGLYSHARPGLVSPG